MGRNFPELLVKDLKNSASMFTSRHISSGPPEPTLLAEEPEIHDDCPDMSRSDRPPSCYQLPKLKRVCFLGGVYFLCMKASLALSPLFIYYYHCWGRINASIKRSSDIKS